MKILPVALLMMASVAFVLLGCSDNSSSPVEPGSQSNSASAPLKVAPRADIALQGFVRWDVYGKREHTVIVDPTVMFTLCAAELNFTDKHNFVLHTMESFDNGDGTQTLFREVVFNGTMTPSGQLRFAWPESWREMNWDTGTIEPSAYPTVVAQIRAHTGYTLTGPGVNKNTVNFTGSFDGNTFFADCHVMGFQEEPGMMEPYDVVVDGPIAFGMSLELKVSD